MPDESARTITDRYNREALDYRELWAPVLRQAGASLIGRLAGEPAPRIVEVGAGVGSLLSDLRAAFPGVVIVGADRSRGMLALAPAAFPRAVMDARALALKSGSVDLVLMLFMLFHLDDPCSGLREALRVLAPRGRVATLTWAGEMESPASRIWARSLDAHGAAPLDPSSTARHELVDSPEKMAALLREAGFREPDCGVEPLVSALDADHLVRLRTRMGANKPRFDSLEPAARAACMASARRRMAGLTREDFVARGRVVYAIARAATS
ncbi:MAG: class I SAM-dependent methyltransferase [Deltaproteobacteria bacterium]|nr:MAG: class I SAM-dependent methyltransferase [Deltaproteobacteria bacterium]